MDIDLDIKVDPDLLQIRLRSTHQYPNTIQIHFKSTQIQIGFGSRGSWVRSNPLPSIRCILQTSENKKEKEILKI